MPQRDEDRSWTRPNARGPKASEGGSASGSAPSWDERTYHGGPFGYGGWDENYARSAPRERSPHESGTMARRSYRGIGPQGYVRSDERIKEDVSEELRDDPDVDASEIRVAVKDAEVTLAGSVPEPSMRPFAEQAASRAPGVRLVHNELRLFAHPERG